MDPSQHPRTDVLPSTGIAVSDFGAYGDTDAKDLQPLLAQRMVGLNCQGALVSVSSHLQLFQKLIKKFRHL